MNKHMNTYFEIDKDLIDLANEAEEKCESIFKKINETAQINQYKVIKAFKDHRVSEIHFHPSTGYGYGDQGRAVLDDLYGQIFGCEDAIVRSTIASGTVALHTAMFANLRPNDEILFATGRPYDTLMNSVGVYDAPGSMKEYGITHKIIDLNDHGKPQISKIIQNIRSKTKMVFIQRSRGYQWNNHVNMNDIKQIIKKAKEKKPSIVVMVDNCYGEFVNDIEPTHLGADLMAGSLIKNPGGGLCPSGGYIVGKKHLIENCASNIYAPGLSKEVGSSITDKRLLFQGLYMAPHTVAQCLMGSVFSSALFESLGYETSPKYLDDRFDIIQLVKFTKEKELVAFCQGIQESSPVDSHVTPHPWDMPGYNDPIIMAAGTFVSGSSIEFSADAPIRNPYIAYMQGGLVYAQVKLGVLLSLQRMKKDAIIKLEG